MIREFGYEYETIIDNNLMIKDKGKFADSLLFGAHCLRSGRDALKAIAREFRPCKIYLPALVCDTVISPFLMWGYEVVFYGLNSDYSIQLEDLKINQEEEYVLFFYMDYFGNPSISDINLEKIRNTHTNVIFIEDRTHSLIWNKKTGFIPDYTIVSLRKWIDIPDGGLLWGKTTIPYEIDNTFSEERLKAQCMRYEYLKNGDEKIKKSFREKFYKLYLLLDSDKNPYSMSLYSFHKAYYTDWEELKIKRWRNGETLISVLKQSPYIRLIQNDSSMSGLYVPFLVKNRNVIQERLSALGIFNTIIWPLTKQQKDICNVAKYTEENMLAAPCDQRYEVDDMLYIGEKIIQVVDAVNRQ